MALAEERYDEGQLQEYGEGQGASTTQLSEQFPQIDTPLRIDPPPTLKSPARTESLTLDRHIRDAAFSPKALTAGATPLPSVVGARRTKIDSSLKSLSEGQAAPKTAVADFSLLATSSQRAGRVANEGQAYLARAITLDNIQQYAQAMESYKKLLALCKKMGDGVVEGLACNCLGVDAMLIACPPSEVAKN